MDEKRTARARALVLGVAIAGLFGVAQGCGEGTAPPAPRPDLEGGPGRILYLTYCAGCHGPSGRGDGRAAAALRTPPPDLTQLSARYGTPLDREALGEYIDGRLLLGLHGPREMPVWGEEFFADAPPSTPGLEHTRDHLVRVLVDYLQTLQTARPL